jgi:hypothetical protein
MPRDLPSPRELFPNGRFSPPATEDQIVAVERELGVRLPNQLRRLYFECDGFREDRGNAKYLLSLTDDDFIGSLLKMTRFWWDAPPLNLDFRPYIFFGSSSGDESWGIDCRDGSTIIAYHHDMEHEYEVAGRDILDVWRVDYAKYGEAHDV